MTLAIQNLKTGLRLESVGLEDEEFLRRLYASTRPDIVDSGLPDEQKQQLLDFQYRAQHLGYSKQFGGVSFNLICLDDEPIGRICVQADECEIQLIDISLMPEQRRKGIGTRLIGDLLARSEMEGVPVRLRVSPENPATKLYQRLGFQVVEREQTPWRMEWIPDSLRSESHAD